MLALVYLLLTYLLQRVPVCVCVSHVESLHLGYPAVGSQRDGELTSARPRLPETHSTLVPLQQNPSTHTAPGSHAHLVPLEAQTTAGWALLPPGVQIWNCSMEGLPQGILPHTPNSKAV